ncbi:hypothetical protein GCM10010094_77960 [Streptomyces flaveus]|uniref:CoA-binding domain-containing protein n=1 Tax=Streptomyces flaveus TaxID=66370 RepID=A0A917RGS6_9ACTN|nr:hypothetical protein GCM10010094_77960 [Streptomyces flaveus]
MSPSWEQVRVAAAARRFGHEESPRSGHCCRAQQAPQKAPRRPNVYGDSATVRKILTELGDTWAVVGLSTNERRAAYGVAGVLKRYGKRIVPVHPKAETVHGEKGYASLSEIPFDVATVL